MFFLMDIVWLEAIRKKTPIKLINNLNDLSNLK